MENDDATWSGQSGAFVVSLHHPPPHDASSPDARRAFEKRPRLGRLDLTRKDVRGGAEVELFAPAIALARDGCS